MINIPTLGIYVTVKFSGVALPHALTHLGLDIDRCITTEKNIINILLFRVRLYVVQLITMLVQIIGNSR